MGFLGKIRNIVAKNASGSGYDVAKISDSLVAEAKLASKATDISSFFSKQFVKQVGNTPMIGKTKLLDFSSFARQGSFAKSFDAAFPANAALKNLKVRATIDKLLLDARRTLPDFRFARNSELVNNAAKGFSLNPKTLRNADDLAIAAAANPKLNNAVTKLLNRAKSGKSITAFGVTVLIGATATAAIVFERMTKLAEEYTGCIAYWADQNGNIRKCKVAQYSCKFGDKGETCLASVIPTIVDNKDCLKPENKDKICIHCDENDKLNADLPENMLLKCEEKTAGDMLLETIGNTLGDVWGGVSSTFSTLFIVGAIFLVIVIVLVVVINLIR